MQAAMMKNALPVAAFASKSAGEIFAEVRKSGRRLVVENDCPACVLMSPEEYEQIMDLLADMRTEQIAAERLSAPMDEGITFEEYLEKHGITQEYLDSLPEVEIE